MRVHVLGGFLGAGKTALARSVASELRSQGERVALITNDQGRSLVDTRLCQDAAPDVREITGGCFCCRYPALETALLAARDSGATVAIAEAVGSCTDLVATVLAPLADRCAARLVMQPLAVVVDPWRVRQMQSDGMPDNVAFLFRKQIEEADVILLSRADLGPPQVTDAIRRWNRDAPIIAVSGLTGGGISEWLTVATTHQAQPLLIDYERYAAAEALLGWCNARVRIRGAGCLDTKDSMRRFLRAMSRVPVAHVKVTSLDPAGGWGAIVRQGGTPHILDEGMSPSASELTWLVNARVALAPERLERAVRQAMTAAFDDVEVTWDEFECFSPSRPNPTHRYATRRATTDDSSCCTAFYQRPDVRLLLGDSFHPGGTELTLRMMHAAGLTPGETVLDVACGRGESLRAVLEHWPVSGIGIDAAATSQCAERLDIRVGDAHDIPLEAESADMVLCECALSTFVDQPGALGEMRRVLRPGGRLALSDMVLEGEVPESLRDWVHSGTCLERALSADSYVRSLTNAGFTMLDQWDASDGLTELMTRIKRRLVGWMLASASSGVKDDLPFDPREARRTLRDAERAVADGIIRYGVFVAARAD